MEIELSRLVDALPGLVWVALPDGRARFLNPRWCEYTGLSQSDAIDHGWQSAIHPDDLAELMQRWGGLVSTGRPVELTARLRRHDGLYRRFLFSASPVTDEAGQVVGWCGINTDIEEKLGTEGALRQRAEAMLDAERRLLEMVARGVALPVVLGEICHEAEALAPGCFCSILLLDADETHFRLGGGPSLPASYNAVLDGADANPAFGPCALAVELKTPVIAADPVNDPRWAASPWLPLIVEHGLASCWSMPILAGDEEVLGSFAIYRREPGAPTEQEQELIARFAHIAGISVARARADSVLAAREAELRRAHGHLIEAQRLSQTGSFTADLVADEHIWSDELYRIFGIEPGTPITFQTARDRIHPDDLPLYEAAIARGLQGVDPDYVFRAMTPGGGVKYLHVVAHRIEQIADRPVFYGAIQDVTDRKLGEHALSRARAELAHVARITTLGALTASIAHEVNQPLSGIITNAGACLRMLAAEPPNLDGARATAQRTIRDGNRASEVIQRLRALFARRQPTIEAVDLNDIAREVLAIAAGEIERAHVTVRAEFAAGLPEVSGDRVQLQQVILNLVLNAVDAMAGAGPGPRELRIGTAPDGQGRVRLWVRDTGGGLPADGGEKLFDAFFTTKDEGMGIGLSISRSIIANHEGRLWAEDNEGPGATFCFSIPARIEMAETVG